MTCITNISASSPHGAEDQPRPDFTNALGRSRARAGLHLKRAIILAALLLAACPAHASDTIIGGRPHGCPHRYCGCGASLHLFGRIIPALNLAANWLRFERTAPAPNTVAVRRHHVFVLKHHIGGNVWTVFDANSGHGRTRIHPRSIAGYTIVNPHGGRG